MRSQLISILTSTVVLGAACTAASAQSATIRLTHDDADGEVRPGDTVTWTLSVAFTGAEACGGGNLRLVANVPGLVESSDFTYVPTIGGNSGGESDGAGGISLIHWNNILFLEAFGGPADHSNPFIAGTFTTTANWFGVLEYRLELGELDLPFITIDHTAFASTTFSRDEVTIEIQPLTIGPISPDGSGFNPDGNGQSCLIFDFIDDAFAGGVTGAVRETLWLPNGDLVVGGALTRVGSLDTTGLARWDGESWHAFGSGIDGTVQALALMPNGDLVAAGKFNEESGLGDTNVARWDGASWTGIGTGIRERVNSLVVLPDGDLVVAGNFSTDYTTSAVNRVARWDGNTWSTIGGGADWTVRDLIVLPNGDLVAGGMFRHAGGVAADRIARWDGVAWHPLGSGMSDIVTSLTLSPEGDLIAGGNFNVAGGVVVHGVAQWDGAAWSAFNKGVGGPGQPLVGPIVNAIESFPDGTLFAVGNGIHRWNGFGWFAVSPVSGWRTVSSTPEGRLVIGGRDGLSQWGSNPTEPHLFRQPESAQTCPMGGAIFEVYSAGPDALTYQWQIADAQAPEGWRSLTNGDNPGLGSVSGSQEFRLRLLAPTQDATLRCVVSNPCGDTVSDAAALVVDTAGCCERVDFNADGVLDGADIAEFVTRFLEGGPEADLNGDFMLDLGDLEVFVFLYLSGCV